MRRYGRRYGVLLAGVVAALALGAPAALAAKGKPTRAATLNLYVGSDVAQAVVAPDVPALEAAAGTTYEEVVASNPRDRIRIQAKLIKRQRPDVLGLQEVETVYQGPKDDPAPATDPVFDFRRLLLKQLRKKGAPYRVASEVENVDVEVPTDQGLDVRLVDHDVLLVRKGRDVKVQQTGGANFQTKLEVPLAGGAFGTLAIPRGYVDANVKIRGRKLHVVNTHLEAFIAGPRNAQATELLAAGGPLESSRPVILLGDLNSAPDGTSSGDSAEAYAMMLAAGFVDRGVTQDTCCWDANLLGGALTTRIDHVLVKPGARGTGAKRTGAENSPLTAAGQLPSDHTGVFSRLRFP
ncbi:MAG: endonuclease/exonuclease/phosphatase family protein [Solirubrobacterales bacterium]